MEPHHDNSQPGKTPETPSKGRLLDWLDVIAKLVGAGALLVAALIANSFQSKLTGVSLQTQREQAESQLRANMFNSLINPLAGPQKDGKMISPEREELLAELLALNFYENFELKPLLDDVSRRLVVETNAKPGGAASDSRETLWSISRRIAQRQQASIAWEWQQAYRSESPGKRDGRRCESYTVAVVPDPGHSTAQTACQLSAGLREIVRLESPDHGYTLMMTISEPDWKNQTVKVSTSPFPTSQGIPLTADPAYNFQLSWFDLPFTDNTLLPDGNRFAVYLRLMQPPYPAKGNLPAFPGTLTVAVLWFPKGYFTPRERPLNYREVQELLGRKPQ